MNTAEQLMLQNMLAVMETYQASDLHLSVANPPMMRVRGQLISVPNQQLTTPSFMQTVVDAWIEQPYIQRLKENKDVVCARTFENKRRFKIAAFYQQGHLALTLSRIPSIIPALQQSGLPTRAQQLALLDRGLVCIVGPFDAECQKTAASFIEYFNQTSQRHILTIEQPVEYIFQDNQSVIEQREVGVDVSSCEHALEAAFHEDVDVILVTAPVSLTAWKSLVMLANTGKLIFVVVHGSSIVTVLQSILHDAGSVEAAQLRIELSRALGGVLNQRMVRTLNGDTIPIVELLIPNDTVRTVIQSGDFIQIDSIIATSREEGMCSLDVSLRKAVDSGRITRQEAMHHAQNPRFFI